MTQLCRDESQTLIDLYKIGLSKLLTLDICFHSVLLVAFALSRCVVTSVVQDWRIELISTYVDLFHPAADPPAAQGATCLIEPASGSGQRFRPTAAPSASRRSRRKYGTARIYWTGRLTKRSRGVLVTTKYRQADDHFWHWPISLPRFAARRVHFNA